MVTQKTGRFSLDRPQLYPKDRPAGLSRLITDCAPPDVCANPAEIEADAGTAATPVGLSEAVKQLFFQRRFYTGALIGDGDQDVVVLPSSRYPHRLVGRGMSNRIFKEVDDHASQVVGIGIDQDLLHIRQIDDGIDHAFHSMNRGQQVDGGVDARPDRTRVGGLGDLLRLGGLHLVKAEQLFDGFLLAAEFSTGHLKKRLGIFADFMLNQREGSLNGSERGGKVVNETT